MHVKEKFSGEQKNNKQTKKKLLTLKFFFSSTKSSSVNTYNLANETAELQDRDVVSRQLCHKQKSELRQLRKLRILARQKFENLRPTFQPGINENCELHEHYGKFQKLRKLGKFEIFTLGLILDTRRNFSRRTTQKLYCGQVFCAR